jgi:hypothetical protein
MLDYMPLRSFIFSTTNLLLVDNTVGGQSPMTLHHLATNSRHSKPLARTSALAETGHSAGTGRAVNKAPFVDCS